MIFASTTFFEIAVTYQHHFAPSFITGNANLHLSLILFVIAWKPPWITCYLGRHLSFMLPITRAKTLKLHPLSHWTCVATSTMKVISFEPHNAICRLSAKAGTKLSLFCLQIFAWRTQITCFLHCCLLRMSMLVLLHMFRWFMGRDHNNNNTKPTIANLPHLSPLFKRPLSIVRSPSMRPVETWHTLDCHKTQG